MKIEIGGGSAPRKHDFLQSDIRALSGIDFVCPAWELDKFVEPNSVEEIFSRYLFEHFTFVQGEMALKTWLKVLKPGGFCEMILPNIDTHIELWRSGNTDRASKGFWGWQREGDKDFWDVHKSGYNPTTLERLIKRVGYCKMEHQEQDPKDIPHIHVKIYKKNT